MQSQSGGVTTKLVLERYKAAAFILSGAFLALLGIFEVFFAWSFLRSLPGLVPPPLINLLLRHFEVFLIELSHLFDRLSGPHDVFLEFCSQNFKFSFSFSFPFSQNFILSWFLIIVDSLNWPRWPLEEVIGRTLCTKRTFSRRHLLQPYRGAREIFEQ